MGDVQAYLPPAGVEIDGPAAKTIALLTRVMLRQLDEFEALTDPQDPKRAEVLESIVVLKKLLSDFAHTYGLIEEYADTIIDNLDEGEDAAYVNRASETNLINGIVQRRLRTVRICTFSFLAEIPKDYANLNSRNEVVLLRRKKKHIELAKIRAAG